VPRTVEHRREVPVRTTNRLTVLLLASVLALSATGCDLNLKDQTRYAVGSEVYGMAEVMSTQSTLEVSLGRVGGRVRQADADTIADVEGIAIVNDSGERIEPSEVRYEPDTGEMGYVVIAFDVSGYQGPWTLEWPDHDPEPIG
jgi:hypothetical protein